MLTKYRHEKYSCDTVNEIVPKLKKYGVAIRPGVLTETECQNMREGMWEYLLQITVNFKTPIQQNNQKSWPGVYKLFLKHSMLMQHWNIGHADFMWKLRCNPKIIETFSCIWDVKGSDLLTSFDGASFHIPPEIMGKGWYSGKDWFHCDQSFTRNEMECVQSWVTANPVNPGDATLAFLEKSHKYHQEFAEKFDMTDKSDWHLLTKEQLDWYIEEKGCKKRYISCPAGSHVLFESRTIHMGMEALVERKEPNFRCIGYICMTPRKWSSESNLKKRIKAFEELRTTNHYPHKTKLFPKMPRTYGQEVENISEIPTPVLGTVGRRLVGYSS